MADSLRSLEMNEDRQVFVDDTGDLSVISGLDVVEQSLAINAGDALRSLVGQPVDAETIGDVEAIIEERLAADPQVTGPQRVEVSDINDNEVEVDVFVSFNEAFSISIEP